MFYLEGECRGDADDEEEGGHDEVHHRHPEPRRVVDTRTRPARVVHETTSIIICARNQSSSLVVQIRKGWEEQ